MNFHLSDPDAEIYFDTDVDPNDEDDAVEDDWDVNDESSNDYAEDDYGFYGDGGDEAEDY